MRVPCSLYVLMYEYLCSDTHAQTVYSDLFNFWSKAIFVGGPGNLDRLAGLALTGPRSAIWGLRLGMRRKSRGLGGLSDPSWVVS